MSPSDLLMWRRIGGFIDASWGHLLIRLAVVWPRQGRGNALSLFPYFRLGLVAVAAACLLAGCGRKGALDAPPGGWQLSQQPGMTPVSSRPAPAAPQAYDEEGRPIAPAGPKRRTPADWLID